MVAYSETLEPGVVTHTCNSRIPEGEAGALLARSRPAWTVVERVRQRETETLLSSRDQFTPLCIKFGKKCLQKNPKLFETEVFL